MTTKGTPTVPFTDELGMDGIKQTAGVQQLPSFLSLDASERQSGFSVWG